MSTVHSLQKMKQDIPENDELVVEMQCILDACKYPETCRWNKRCMEHGMDVSKEAKMVREKVIRRDTTDDTEK